MTDTITYSQEEILNYIKSNFVQDVYEVAIPTEVTLPRDEYGIMAPYIAVQFGDLQMVGARNMANAQAHGYHLPIYIGIVSGDADISKRLANRLNVALLGFSITHGGQVEKRAGGQMYPIPAQMGSYESYVMPASFGVAIEVAPLP